MTKTPLLFRKYVRVLVLCMGGLSFLVGLVHMFIIEKAQHKGVAILLNAEGRAASAHIRAFLDRTVASLHWVDDLDQPGTPLDTDAILDSGYRILRREPAIIGFVFFDGAGCERLSVSRLQPDVKMECGAPPSNDPRSSLFAESRKAGVAYGKVFFPDGSEPHFYLGVASRGKNTGALVAEINLKIIHDSVAAIRVGKSGSGFIVDADDRLIAHSDESLVLKQSRFEEPFPPTGSDNDSRNATDFAGNRVVMASQSIERPAWRVVVEQPVSEAYAPVYAALWSTGALVLAAILGSLLAGFLIADRLSRPLALLRDGVARIAAGDLKARVTLRTHDEIEQVADEFNRMAGALDESRADLEAKVVDRTAALQATTQVVQRQADELSELNSALSESLDDAERRKEDAERANAAKSRFLAVASHDLRQPMHAVGLLVGLLSERLQQPEVRELVGKIQGSVDAMEGLFDSLLDISKLDAGKVCPKWEDFPIESLLERVYRGFAPVAEYKGLTLTFDGSSALVRSDPGLLERIIANLVSNAVRYTATGHVSLRCEALGENLGIFVEDTGIGIPAEYQERIFDEFYQIANSSRDRSQGLGLGLSIVKRCADLLGHRISLQSGETGSVFRVDVPLLGTAGDIGVGLERSREVSERLSGAFVLILDDDVDSRFAADAIYRQWGCHVLTVESVDQAIAALADHLRSPDLIVSDFQLNGGSTGVDAVESIRSHAEATIPAIILTGDVSAPQSLTLNSSFAVLQKPVRSERLKEVSERLLHHGLSDTAPEKSDS
jgi:signal transduction histidine kinase/CheY-like chemotaxis protein